jgi:3-hydroxyisobutyrate dehydrogenase-like beta-hydroxyacid dehydrogenase
MTRTPAPCIGIVGLGIMGGAMARALLAAGHPVIGYDVDPRRARALERAGGQIARTVAEVARADAVITSLPSAEALHQTVAALAVVRPSRRGQVVLETSTLPLGDKMRAERALREQGRILLDAPISGTAVPNPRNLWIMYLSGPVAACRQVRAWVPCFTLDAPRVGAFGAGTKLKLAANHLVGIFNVACAEMTALCRHMGLDPAVALKHMGASPYIGTGLMRLRMPMMLERRYQPASMKIGVWQKDMRIIADMAREVDCATPLLNASAAVYSAAMALGLAEHDTAATAEVWPPRPARRGTRPKTAPTAGKTRR